ncbi:MAG: LAGLIDADG homing endonuclease type 2 [Candidatus Peregrinibacteria bacterium Greene0416_19]|nr:MAG: LAGLIDADG homing endonuclease type 2 [Candidatus Peregrinibacteria bacterium Greene0416_19]
MWVYVCTLLLMLLGNTVGSLSALQRAILIGSLLGDGTLRKQGTRTNALFEVNHAFAFKEYVDWKYEQFRAFVRTPPKARKGRGTRVAYRFTTRSLPVFTQYHEWFYRDGRKCIPADLTLDPMTLAVWFMDDGTKSRSAMYLNTQQCSMCEQRNLQRALLEHFGIKSALNRDRTYHRLRITTESTTVLENIIRPYILPCFQYKLHS